MTLYKKLQRLGVVGRGVAFWCRHWLTDHTSTCDDFYTFAATVHCHSKNAKHLYYFVHLIKCVCHHRTRHCLLTLLNATASVHGVKQGHILYPKRPQGAADLPYVGFQAPVPDPFLPQTPCIVLGLPSWHCQRLLHSLKTASVRWDVWLSVSSEAVARSLTPLQKINV